MRDIVPGNVEKAGLRAFETVWDNGFRPSTRAWRSGAAGTRPRATPGAGTRAMTMGGGFCEAHVNARRRGKALLGSPVAGPVA